MPTADITLTINGSQKNLSTDGSRSLLEVLREDLKLTGTKYGCGEGACGACTVLVDGTPRFSCTTPAAECTAKKVATIEGLANGDKLHPVQEAFCTALAYQCGYCTPGMIMASVALLEKYPTPTEAQIKESLNGHLCRCCGYLNIVAAVQHAAKLASREVTR